MGLFIVFEGVEGSGKSTQSKLLNRRLTSEGRNVRLLREPGGTPTGEYVREWLIGGHDITPLTELLLFSAARASLIDSVIRPALDNDEIVVCDRYIYSTIAYQGYGRGLDMEVIKQANQLATSGLVPDLVVLLDFPPEKGLERKSRRPLDRFEQEELDFHQRVRQGYLEQSKGDAERWLIQDSSQTKKVIAEAVWDRVSELLQENEE